MNAPRSSFKVRYVLIPAMILLPIVVIFVCYPIICLNSNVRVYLVRHAEKASGGSDPALTPAGETRAQELVDVLKDAGVDAIYTSNLQRTQQTAEPLASQLGIAAVSIAISPPPASPNTFVVNVVSLIRSDHWGEDVLVISHSSTIPMILAELSAPGIEPIDEDTGFDHFFIVTVPRFFGDPTLVRARYGPQPQQ